jgi:hypothetical protein
MQPQTRAAESNDWVAEPQFALPEIHRVSKHSGKPSNHAVLHEKSMAKLAFPLD